MWSCVGCRNTSSDSSVEFSRWFTRYRKELVVYRKGLDFHSLRHTTTTMMQRAGVPIASIDELTGHATPGETARYSHGFAMRLLADAIESTKLELSFKS